MSAGFPQRRRPKPSQRNAATCLALVGLITGGLAFLAFTSLILPQIRWVILVLGGMGAFVMLHYVTWGFWLSRLEPPDESEPFYETHHTFGDD